MHNIKRLSIKNLSLPPAYEKELARFIRFGTVGASSTFLDFLVLSSLVHFLNWPALPANLVSYSLGTLNSYLLCTRWVFAEEQSQNKTIRLLQFILINLIGLALSNLLIFTLEQPLGAMLKQPQMGYLPAKMTATLLVFFWNFLANRFWTFGRSTPAFQFSGSTVLDNEGNLLAQEI